MTDRLSEALEIHDNHEPIDPEVLDVFVDAARRVRDGQKMAYCLDHKFPMNEDPAEFEDWQTWCVHNESDTPCNIVPARLVLEPDHE